MLRAGARSRCHAGPGTATRTPIKHFVVLMQENHSFDNYFGTYPGADGHPGRRVPAAPARRGAAKGCVKPFRLGTTTPEDLSQGIGVQKRQYDGGKMDGFVAAYRRLGLEGTTAMGYYDGRDLPYYWNVADQYVLFDRFFCSTGRRQPRELPVLGGGDRTGELGQPLTSSAGYDQLPTIFDRLGGEGVSGSSTSRTTTPQHSAPDAAKADSPQPARPGAAAQHARFTTTAPLAGTSSTSASTTATCAAGTLPAVSYIVTAGSSEHPPGRGSRPGRSWCAR